MKKRKIQIQARDIDVFGFLWVWKLATVSAIHGRFFSDSKARRVVYNRMLSLKRAGFVQNQVVLNRDSKGRGSFMVWTITRRGFDLIRNQLPDLREEGFLSENIEHDLLVSAFHLGNYTDKSPKSVEILTEQELRRLKLEDYPEWAPQTSLHRPDGYWRIPSHPAPELCAIEVELNFKNKIKYRAVGEFYATYLDIKRVFWLVPSKNFADAVLREIGKVPSPRLEIHNFILVADFRSLGWQAPIRVGSDCSKTLNLILPKSSQANPGQASGRCLSHLWFSESVSVVKTKPSTISPNPSIPQLTMPLVIVTAVSEHVPSLRRLSRTGVIHMNKTQNTIALLSLILISASCSSSPKAKLDTDFKNREGKPPFLNHPEIRTIWIPDAIEDDKYIEGHFVHIIEKPTSWRKER